MSDSDIEIIENPNSIHASPPFLMDEDDVMIIEDAMHVAEEIEDQHSVEEKNRKLAEEKKEEGNLAYTAKKYRQALELYTQAIELCPHCALYYNNRSACHLMLLQPAKALQEAKEAVRLDPQYIKGYMRVAKCHVELGDAASAATALAGAERLGASAGELVTERRSVDTLARLLVELGAATTNQDHRLALFCVDRALQVASGSACLRTRRAECLLALGRYDEAQAAAQDVLRADQLNADAIFVRAECLYRQDDLERAISHLQQVLRLAPDHQRAKTAYKRVKQLKSRKEAGNDSFKRGRLEEAQQLYTEALAVDPENRNTNGKLYFNRATVLARLKKPNQALEDCNKAIELCPDYLKAYLRRARCFTELEQHEEAVHDLEKVCQMDRSVEHRQLLANAKLELKKAQRKDFYKILGVKKDATEEELKKAYRKQALVHHPDRHSSATPEVQQLQEHKFKELGEAYSVLSNKQKRRRYDNGQDLEETGGCGGAGEFDPNSVFQAFFGGAPGGAPGGFTFSTGAMPQGFQFQQQPGGFQYRFG